MEVFKILIPSKQGPHGLIRKHTYEPGIQKLAPDMPILAYKDFDCARNYWFYGTEIWLCYTPRAWHIERLIHLFELQEMSDEQIIAWWTDPNPLITMVAPTGTVACDGITLVRRIAVNDHVY